MKKRMKNIFRNLMLFSLPLFIPLFAILLMGKSCMAADEFVITADTEKDAAKEVREDFLSRTDSQNYQNDRFTYSYTIYVAKATAECSDKTEGAQALATAIRQYTGVANEGDYFKYNLSCTVNSDLNKTGMYGYKMYIGWLYTSGEKEAAMTEAVADFQKSYIREDMTEYEKFRTIYKYICSNVVYAYETTGDFVDYIYYTPYSALLNNKATCTGFSTLVYRLCLENGIPCRVIDGAGHARNIVCIDGKWYVCDATWDTGKNLDTFKYFLVGKDKAEDMIQADNSTTKDIFEDYEISDTAYERPAGEEEETDGKENLALKYTPGKVAAIAVNPLKGKKGIKVTWKAPKNSKVTGYQIYRSVNSKAYKKLKTCSSKSRSFTDKRVKKGRTYRYKIRAYYKKDGKTYYGEFRKTSKVKEK